MKDKIWQDETVQAMKKGYLSTIDDLQARITALETVGRKVLEAREKASFTKLANALDELAALLTAEK